MAWMPPLANHVYIMRQPGLSEGGNLALHSRNDSDTVLWTASR
jgi:hypothetical protein